MCHDKLLGVKKNNKYKPKFKTILFYIYFYQTINILIKHISAKNHSITKTMHAKLLFHIKKRRIFIHTLKDKMFFEHPILQIWWVIFFQYLVCRKNAQTCCIHYFFEIPITSQFGNGSHHPPFGFIPPSLDPSS